MYALPQFFTLIRQTGCSTNARCMVICSRYTIIHCTHIVQELSGLGAFTHADHSERLWTRHSMNSDFKPLGCSILICSKELKHTHTHTHRKSDRVKQKEGLKREEDKKKE